MEIEKSLFDNLQDFFGFDTFKGDQEAIITSILQRRDTFVIMPTGGGKSICYQLPALMSEGTAIVISPLIALMKNQVDQLRAFGGEDSIAHFLNSSLNKSEITKVKDDVIAGKTKLLYVAPESLAKQDKSPCRLWRLTKHTVFPNGDTILDQNIVKYARSLMK